MLEQLAKELVVRAGQELVKSGLIARTWGNVSCRIDEHTFAITPSGRAYETLKPEDIVLCKVEDASYEGDIKPSSEKGIHALVYRTRPNINFVIHTHQPQASAVSTYKMSGIPVTGYPLLGTFVPIAGYGLPGTKKLKQNIGKSLDQLEGHAVIMAHHGALMFGSSYEETFSAASQLEAACLSYIQSQYLKTSGAKQYLEEAFYQYYVTAHTGDTPIIGKKPSTSIQSKRLEGGFLVYGEKEKKYFFADPSMPDTVKMHCAIYEQRKDINYIIQNNNLCLMAIASSKANLRPLLDDFAQIVGLSARCSKSSKPSDITRALQGRLGVFVPGNGAFCCAATQSDAQAVAMVLQKDAYAQISAKLFGGGHSLSLFDCKLMHFVYTKSYAKKATTTDGK